MEGVSHSLCSLAERQDERIDMVFGATEWDEHQEYFIQKNFSKKKSKKEMMTQLGASFKVQVGHT